MKDWDGEWLGRISGYGVSATCRRLRRGWWRARSPARRAVRAVGHVTDDQPGPGGRQLDELGLHPAAQRLPADRDQLARQHDEFRIQHGDHRGETGRESGGEQIEEPGVRAVLARLRGLGGPGDQPGRDLVMGARAAAELVVDAELPGQPGQHLRARQLLESARVRLGDLADQGHAGHRQEADLTGTTGEAAVQPPVDDEGGTEPLLVPQQDEVVVPARRAEPLFGHRDEVHVVLVLDRHRQKGGQLVQQGGGVPAGQVRGVPQPPGTGVEGPRRPDDDPVHIGAGQPGVLYRPVQRLRHLPHHGVGTPPRGAQLELPDRLTGHIGDGGDDPLGVHIQPSDMGGPRVHRVQLRIGPRPPGHGPGGDNQPGRLQPRQQLRGGGLGEPGQLSDPGPRQGPVLQQQIEGGPVVHGPQNAGVPGVVPATSAAPALC